MGSSMKAGLLFALWTIPSLLLVTPADAAKIIFSINNATSGSNYKESGDLACNSPTDILNIAGTYDLGGGKSITIAPIDGTALARIICDEAGDVIALRHAKITTTTPPVDNVKIGFRRTYTGATNPSDYSVSGNGTFGGTPNGSWLAVRGYVAGGALGALSDPANPPPCNGVLVKCATAIAASWPFSSPAFSVTTTVDPLSSPRELKSQFWFKLVSGATLTFSSAKGITVKFGPPPGQGLDEEPCCPEGKQCLACTPEHLVGKMCSWFGAFCPACVIPEPSGPPVKFEKSGTP